MLTIYTNAELRYKFSLEGGVHRTMSICWFGYHYTAPHTDLIWNCISMAQKLLCEKINNRIHRSQLCFLIRVCDLLIGRVKDLEHTSVCHLSLFVCVLHECYNILSIEHSIFKMVQKITVQLKKFTFLQMINYLSDHCTRLRIAGSSR